MMVAALAALLAAAQGSEGLPLVAEAELQPLKVQLGRLREALDYLGTPPPPATAAAWDAALAETDPALSLRRIQAALDPLCLLGVHINPESRVKSESGPAPKRLVERGWSQSLIKVHNEAGVTARLRVLSPQAASMHNSPAEQQDDLWLDLQSFDARPLAPALSGAKLEYRILQLYSRDAGKRSAVLSFDVGQGTQDIGFRSDVLLTFDAAPSKPVRFSVLDEHGRPTTACFVFRDAQGRVHPSQAKRSAPDFAFHPQIYRADGEEERLPPGAYQVEISRGPEYLAQTRALQVGEGPTTLEVRLRRWIDPSLLKWWSGDHHIHASGCAHYTKPQEGVHAPDMLRHIVGEDLKIGATLTWGPGFDYQKRFFTGQVDKVSTYPYLLRYDVEVSGFGSHQSGHLCLLRLKEQLYPGGDSSKHWPTLCLNTLKWAKRQGAITGPAHSGWGLGVQTDELPTYEVPPFDSIGAMETIVDLTHEVPGPDGTLVPAVDFLSAGDTPYVWEHNFWYHVLNAGFRPRISGETDFPCIYGERVGLGRAYVKLDGRLDYDLWCEGIQKGRAYVSDGRSHLIDFTLGGVELGTAGSELKLASPARVRATVKAAALLPEKPDPSIRPYAEVIARAQGKGSRWAGELKPFWHVERARLGDRREVAVELVVNAYPVARRVIPADGSMQDLSFDLDLAHSSWVALRILGTCHSNPVFVEVAGKPIRASRRSVKWCQEAVERCWSQKERFIAPEEKADAVAAYDHARKVYARRLEECERD
jgi:hypothetical protein